MRILEALKAAACEFSTAQPAAFDTSSKGVVPPPAASDTDAWHDAYRSYDNGRKRSIAASVAEVRPELDECAKIISTRGRRVATRYNPIEQRAELFAPDGTVLAEVYGRNAEFSLSRVFIKTEDAELRNLLLATITREHHHVEVRPDERPIPGKWY